MWCYHRFDHAYQTDQSTSYQAFMTSNSGPPDQGWYPDTAAAHHLTFELSNLNLRADEYTGTDKIRVGNIACLPIHHTCDSYISSSKFLFLRQLLHVPSIQKNLISASKFTLDNNIFF